MLVIDFKFVNSLGLEQMCFDVPRSTTQSWADNISQVNIGDERHILIMLLLEDCRELDLTPKFIG